MLKVLRQLFVPLVKLGLSLALTIVVAAVAIDFISGRTVSVAVLEKHVLTGLAVGAFAALFLAAIASAITLIIRQRAD